MGYNLAQFQVDGFDVFPPVIEKEYSSISTAFNTCINKSSLINFDYAISINRLAGFSSRDRDFPIHGSMLASFSNH